MIGGIKLKSIALVNTPESCSECCFQKGLTVYGYACGMTKTMNENTHARPDWCPLIPLPKRHTAPKTATGYEIGYEDGWNDCLDDITGTDSEIRKAQYMNCRDKKPRYKGICPVCGKTNWICKSIAMEFGVNTGIGHCLWCNAFLNVKFNEERQEMELEIYEDYLKRTSEKEGE